MLRLKLVRCPNSVQRILLMLRMLRGLNPPLTRPVKMRQLPKVPNTNSMSVIEDAIAYVRQTVILPAIQHPELEAKVKARAKNSLKWLERFDRVGDLLIYLQRFEGDVSKDTYQALKMRGLLTFEDIIGPFEQRFGTWAEDRTSPNSFVVGQKYSSYQLLIFVQSYDVRAGGMFLVGGTGGSQAVVIKATLNGAKYPNKWIDPHHRLKYYLKSRNGVFGEHFQENRAILTGSGVPVLAFVREQEGDPFTYEGVFCFEALNSDADGSKWFALTRSSDVPTVRQVSDQGFVERRLGAELNAARNLTDEELFQKLGELPKKPRQLVVQSVAYERSPLVIEAALRRAKGQCEICANPAPFLRRRDSTPYLEVHHRVRLADGGDDTLQNAVAVCPNCHRREHFA